MIKKCVICGKLFNAKMDKQKYCGHDCAKIAAARKAAEWRKNKSTLTDKVCVICGKTFTPYNNLQKCCSEECKREHGRRLTAQRYYAYIKRHGKPVKVAKSKVATMESCFACTEGMCDILLDTKHCGPGCRFYKTPEQLERENIACQSRCKAVGIPYGAEYAKQLGGRPKMERGYV